MLFLIDWLAFVPKGHVLWSTVWISLIPPMVYGLWAIPHGATTRWYPYPFVDMRSLGYEEGLKNMASFMAMFIAVELALIVIDRLIGSLQRSRR